ncbi:MAG: DNA primase [Acidobacteriota bacterium]|jgi:DNA primase|nr:DNA primase [Acidobacteriota bacterium]
MARYDDGFWDTVRDANNIVTVVSSYVELRKKGRDYKACCPFHTEKTPSFTVSEEKQAFYCFGCHEGGDVIAFVRKIENLSPREALEFLAERAGIELPAPEGAPDDRPAANKKDMYRMMAEATTAYQQALLTSAEGKPALQYLQGRGVSLDAIAKFQLGFSPPGGRFLTALLQNKGYPAEMMEECGLCRRSEEGNRTYDYFRGRVMFPIADIQGRPVAFGARAMDDGNPKYLNSPETRLYNKSRNLFGLCHAREAVRKRGAILVEGYMDCIVPSQHGVDNIVASCGTALTREQVALLGRYTRDVVVSYDADAAGQNAAQKSLELFLEGDFQVRVLRLPEGKDPDEYIRRAGVEEYRRREQEAVPYLDFVLEKAIAEQGGDRGIAADPRAKVRAMNAVLQVLALVPSPVERSERVSICARRLGIEDDLLLAELRKAAKEGRTTLPREPVGDALVCKPAEKRLLRLLLEDGGVQDELLPLCDEEDFAGLAGGEIFSIILAGFKEGRRESFESLRRRFTGDRDQAFLAQLEMEELPEEPALPAAKSCLNALWAKRLEEYKGRVKRQVAEASARGDEEEVARLGGEIARVNRELLRLRDEGK